MSGVKLNRAFLMVFAGGHWLGQSGTCQVPKVSLVPNDSAIRQILVDRIDKYRQSVGIVVGVIDPRGRRIVAYGNRDHGDAAVLNGDTVFEIGSITKVFTTLLLAEMVQRGEVALDDPVAKYLSAKVRVPERGGRQITLRDLATHTSGLPHDPSNLSPQDPANPVADYSVEQLYSFLASHSLQRDIGIRYEYSNVGVSLLGHALASRLGMDYEELLAARILRPLGINSTRFYINQAMNQRLAPGHSYLLERLPNWDMGALTPGGGLKSTASDLLTLLGVALGYQDTPLASAMANTMNVRRPAGHPDRQTGLGWEILTLLPGYEFISHSGATGGYRTFVGMDRGTPSGVVVLSNAATPSNIVGHRHAPFESRNPAGRREVARSSETEEGGACRG